MDDRGTLHWFLGMQILRSENMITIDQERYIESVLEQFNMSDCKPMATPGEVNVKLVKASREYELVNPNSEVISKSSWIPSIHWETNTS